MKIFAHRGLSALYPENTLAALSACADYGVGWFETDVDIIADGTAVLMHDTALDRTTNRSASLYELSRADLETIDAGAWFGAEFAGQKIPTLAQAVELMNQEELKANIELKSNEQGRERSLQLIDAVLAELENCQQEVLISSFNHLLLAEFKRRAPQYRVAALFTTEMLQPDWLSVLELIGAQALHPEDRGLSQEQVGAFLAAGYEVNVWTVNSRARANELKNWGVTGIFTDHAQSFLDLEN